MRKDGLAFGHRRDEEPRVETDRRLLGRDEPAVRLEEVGGQHEALSGQEGREDGRVVSDIGVMRRIDLADLGRVHRTRPGLSVANRTPASS